jgi:hypothetical protein
LSLTAAVLLASTSLLRADDLLPADKNINEAVDHYIAAALKRDGISPAPQADDANLIRRLTLDLVGRIPTVAETKAFVESTDADKRVKLVDRLMASPAFVRHQATELDVMLMYGNGGSVRDYLLKALAENRSWDRIYRDIMLTDEADPGQKGAGDFVKTRLKDLDKLTNDVSVLFFGVNISCAKCHDHPRVADWKQDHFYGMKSFFARTFDNGGFVAEREFATAVKFRTTAGQDKQAKMMFLTGKMIDTPEATIEGSNEEQKLEKDRLETAKKNKTAPPRPKFSARQQLVELSLQPEQRVFFAKSIVNRVWHRLLGHGLVMPLDQMHSQNPPSHPELLDWLARDVAEHDYDLRRLTRGLVLSQAYARSSRWTNGDPPKPQTFAVARVRPLTPMQLATSLRLATNDPASFADTLKPEELEKKIEQIESAARGFAGSIEQPRDDFQISVAEALLFSNGDRILKEYLADTGGLMGRLKQMTEPKETVDMAVRTVLSRPPSEQEMQVLTDYLSKRSDRPGEARRQMVWALLAGAEFRFNY